MTLVAAIERIFIVNTPHKEVSCASSAAQVFSENHIRQHEWRTHSACPCCDAALGLLSASVSATRRRIRLRKLASSTDV
ncbi:hypothetical protein C6Q22_08700 [Burkholderia multivorans]|nr:hypothetical protein C6P86_26970 [Burkholderia multivorans]PRE80411.1 hypothetical protein C6Q00_19570 [Burkholderia multivorans]PRF90973.1 hypothetical protein C6Q22_08700 [Burkholderia multivorans]PRG20381.1 hypothetical protein C6T57_18930 [Burkholderia multivorans]PRG58372.1 hypothetical protein C6T69_30675 [Burkholderia multivorans]